MTSGIMGYLGMASPNFIADAMLYKMKQNVLDSANPRRHFDDIGRPTDNRQPSNRRWLDQSNEQQSLIREIQAQNEILQRREIEREDRLQASSAVTLKKKHSKRRRPSELIEDALPQMPKKRPLQINNMKMAEVFDPYQFIANNNQSSLGYLTNRSVWKLDAI